ncbi:MAG: hypothetical protein U9R01_03755, partial [candidate division WOR-3 bacterium]|nr:hypothetical protein [candidate division WOR-3 bacterium]
MSQTKNKKITALVTIILIILISTPFLSLGCGKEVSVNDREEYPTTDSLCSLFDELDNKVNNGEGYSKYLNIDGFPTGALLAWSESYLMQAYADMYRATGDIKYLDKL